MNKQAELQQIIQELFQETIEQCKAQGVPLGNFNPVVMINPRAKRRWGACKSVGRVGRNTVFQIEISKSLAENGSPFDISNTLVHELLHTCKGCMNHGKLWQYHAARMNRAYGYHVKATASGDEMESQDLHNENRSGEYKYAATCQGCGATVYRMKKSAFIEHPDRYKCRNCGGSFQVSVLR